MPLQTRAAPNLKQHSFLDHDAACSKAKHVMHVLTYARTLNLEPDETPRGTPADAEVALSGELTNNLHEQVLLVACRM